MIQTGVSPEIRRGDWCGLTRLGNDYLKPSKPFFKESAMDANHIIAEQYLPVLLLILVAVGLGGMFTMLGILIGPVEHTEVKKTPFESGMPSEGTGFRRYSVRFYMIAMIFLIFDVEVIFLYPWAVKFRELGWFGFAELSVFLVILLLGLGYAWKKGALEWE
ncbi:MAG: NADH-quinone oxidoreductase subunit A [Deltaproteobacteria bacterium]|nr:NADH-quinone oxidoreductase subunit A [Deltaproteobacteria bacterium]